jgi:drug/metabolite transporter (DMT)-like permease
VNGNDPDEVWMKSVPQNQEFSLLAILFAVVLCTLFGANAVAIKISLSGLGVLTTAALRFSIASIVISLWAKATGQSFYVRNEQRYQLLILSIIFTVQLSLFYLGLSRTNASRGTLVVNLMPFFILFLAHYFIPGDRISTRKALGMLMGFLGIALVFLDKKSLNTDLHIGDLIILTASFIWACNTVYVKRIIDSFNPFHLALYPMIFSIPFFFIGGLLWDGTMIGTVNTKVLASLLYQGLVTASFGFVAWNYMLRKYGATSLHSFVFIMPITGVFLGGFVLGEPITTNILFALIFVTAGIMAVHFKTQKPTPLSSLRRGI